MGSKNRFIVTLIAGIIVLLVLIWATITSPVESVDWSATALFGVSIVFTSMFGVALGGGIASLQPMITIAAYLVLGRVPSAWLAFTAAIPHGIIRYYFGNRLGMPRTADRMGLMALTPANAAMHATTILVSGLVYENLGGIVPLTDVDRTQILPLLCFGLTYFCVNHVIAAAYFGLRGRAHLEDHLRQLGTLIGYEATPMIIAPLIALIYVRLGSWQVVFFALVLAALSLITHNLDQTRQRLERRVKELNSLQSVGQALSSSLELGTILSAIHAQVVRLMPASTFYIALYDPVNSKLEFPLAVEYGEKASWPSRETGTGLTEYVLRTRQPLLIKEDVSLYVDKLGLQPVIMNAKRRLASSWLGVPILAGEEVLGVISVQSVDTPSVYDEMHRDVLVTIAAQAAVAIKNAYLFASTDTALSRRVQELDSILNTTKDGVLLLDTAWRVLAVNPAFCRFVGLSRQDLEGMQIACQPGGEMPLITLIGYTERDLQADCRSLVEGKEWRTAQTPMPGVPDRTIQRTLVPVFDRNKEVTGWLFVFRDNSEEIELSRMREDLTHMLVHDLRSPLAVILGSVETGRTWLDVGKTDEVHNTLILAKRSGERMLRLVNNLLDVYRFENGEVPIIPQRVPVNVLLAEAHSQSLPVLAETRISLHLEEEPGLPELLVDSDYMIRVLQNLVDNAVKFTPDGGSIRLWARSDGKLSPSSRTLLVGISDNGSGILPEVQDKIFDKFQHSPRGSGRRPGTGLGLPFCRMIVEAHGGEMWVESTGAPGEGSTFVMRLPLAE